MEPFGSGVCLSLVCRKRVPPDCCSSRFGNSFLDIASHFRTPRPVRLILTFPLLICVTLACLSDCVVVIGFYVNRSYIATNLCEKKDVPGNTCRGCCLLRKELQNEDRKAQSPPARNLKEFGDFQPVPVHPPIVYCPPRSGQLLFASLSSPVSFPPGRDIDHPPEVSSL